MRNSRSILLAEDDRVDAMTIKRAFGDLKVSNPLVRASNGEEALQYLRRDDSAEPCLILLDLNMPKMNGIEFLKAVKADEQLRQIPVVVLTTSAEEQDIVDSFKCSVAGYIVKPLDYKEFVEALKAVDVYWTLSELPSGK